MEEPGSSLRGWLEWSDTKVLTGTSHTAGLPWVTDAEQRISGRHGRRQGRGEMKLHPWLSGPGDLGEDVGCLALCKAESAVSQLLTQPQMLLRSPRDGPRLRAPKKYQAGHWTRSLPRCKGPQRPCTDPESIPCVSSGSWAPVHSHKHCLGGTWRRAAELS